MSDGTEARVRVVVAAFGDGERGRVWRDRLGGDYKLAAELLIDGIAALGVDFDEIDGERVREIVATHLPARLSGAESFAADVPDLLEDFLDSAADELGLARKWEWLTAVGESRGAFASALDDPDRLRVAPPRQEPVRRPGAKLGRNDPCPCGSGKKYKHCCLHG